MSSMRPSDLAYELKARCCRGAASLLLVAWGGTACAQADANAVRAAGDAFGFRQGDDAIGIYDERSARGFNLEAAGNYRIDGSYFVRNSGVSSFFVESTTVQVGAANLGIDLPGPSGVVNYRLRDPTRRGDSQATIGVDVYDQPYADLHLQGRSHDQGLGWSVGVSRVFETHDTQGGPAGESLLVGGLLRRNLESGSVRVFGGDYAYVRPSAYRIAGADPRALPRLQRGERLVPDWARDKGQRRIAGALLDFGGDRSGYGGTLVVSQEDPSRAYLQLLSAPDAAGISRAILVSTPHQRSTAWSGEARAHLEWSADALNHRLDVALRGRHSSGRYGGAAATDLGRPIFGEAPIVTAPPLEPSGAPFQDAVDQTGVSLTWRIAAGDWLTTNLGVMRTNYRKRLLKDGRQIETSRADPWLFNMAASVRVTPRLRLQAGWTRGLEEAGVAPASAANANAVLQAVEVDQKEASFAFALRPGLTAVAGVFEIEKPYAAIDPRSGIFRSLGRVRHRGVEASVSGQLSEQLSMVAGGAWILPELSGEAVEAALIGPRPIGTPKLRAVASLDYRIPRLEGFSVDAGVTYVGSRPSASALLDGRQPHTFASYPVNLGARYRFTAAGRDFTLRVQLQNIFNQYRWDVAPGETLVYTPGRQVRAVLTAPV